MNAPFLYFRSSRSSLIFGGAKVLICMLLGFLISGCASREEVDRKRVENTPAYRPTNVFAVPALPAEVRRIALLPVYSRDYPLNTRTMLAEQAGLALTQTNRFEVVVVGDRDLSGRYGRNAYTATEVLPHDFFEFIEQRYAADAILFIELTQYDPYQPIRLGFRANLVSIENGESLWAFDDAFNAGDARVMSGAGKYASMSGRLSYPLNNSSTVLKSPSQFAGYAFTTAFSTLPARGTTLDTLMVTRPDAQRPTEQPNPSDQPESQHAPIPSLK